MGRRGVDLRDFLFVWRVWTKESTVQSWGEDLDRGFMNDIRGFSNVGYFMKV